MNALPVFGPDNVALVDDCVAAPALPPGAVGQQDLNDESAEIHDREEEETLLLGNVEEQQGLEEETGGVEEREERPVGNLEEEPLEPINTYEGRKQQAVSKIKAMESKLF